MIETIYYRELIGRNTRDILREMSKPDQEYVKRFMQGLIDLSKVDPRPEFGQWFSKPNKSIPPGTLKYDPKLKGKKPPMQSPHDFCQGIINKLNQRGCDLSPRQHEGIETVTRLVSELYEENACPKLIFKNKLTQFKNPIPPQFNNLFKR